MKFSSRAIYGMRAMLALAKAHGHGSTFLKEIVEREGLPGTYLEQLMKLSETMKITAKCGLGQSVANSFSSIVTNFKEEMIY